MDDGPIWSSSGLDDYYFLAGDTVEHHTSLGDFVYYSHQAALAGQEVTSVVYCRFGCPVIANAYQSGGWSVFNSFYQSEIESLAAHNAAYVRSTAEAAGANGTIPCLSEDGYAGMRYVGRGVVSVSQNLSLSVGDVDGGQLQAGETFVLAAGRRLSFDELFTDPAAARRRAAEHLSGITGLSAKRAAACLTDYGFFFAENGQLVLFCPGETLGDIRLDIQQELYDKTSNSNFPYDTRWDPDAAVPLTGFTSEFMADFEEIGVHFIHNAVEFPLPAGLLDDLLVDFS